MTIEELEKMLSDRPNRIITSIELQEAMNGYGFIKLYEVKIELRARRCIYCKLREPRDNFCPVNGIHAVREDWTLSASGGGKTLSEAIDRVAQIIPVLV